MRALNLNRRQQRNQIKYEIYVVTEDGYYVAGGTTTYTRKATAEQTASSWLEGMTGRRAYVVTL